jgi:hypothetical protein
LTLDDSFPFAVAEDSDVERPLAALDDSFPFDVAEKAGRRLDEDAIELRSERNSIH